MITYISVVRDFDLYKKLVRDNPYCQGAVCVNYDNRIENKPISERYNAFLDSYNYDKESWFVFCHEDFELLSQLEGVLGNLSRGCLYGSIGSKHVGFWGFGIQKIFGNMTCIKRDGSGCEWKAGKWIDNLKLVDTFDCCCLIVHSSLVQRYNLRFDPKLTYDFYVEDFCANAFLCFGVKSYVLPVLSCHHSSGIVPARFWRHLPYLSEKYPFHFFVSTITYFGTLTRKKMFQNRIVRFVRPLVDGIVRLIRR